MRERSSSSAVVVWSSAAVLRYFSLHHPAVLTVAPIQGSGFKTLKEGQRVSYDVTTGPKGQQASNIRPAD